MRLYSMANHFYWMASNQWPQYLNYLINGIINSKPSMLATNRLHWENFLHRQMFLDRLVNQSNNLVLTISRATTSSHLHIIFGRSRISPAFMSQIIFENSGHQATAEMSKILETCWWHSVSNGRVWNRHEQPILAIWVDQYIKQTSGLSAPKLPQCLSPEAWILMHFRNLNIRVYFMLLFLLNFLFCHQREQIYT